MEENQNPSDLESFSQYLAKLGISKVSYKNYKSDISHFASWLMLRLRAFGVITNNMEACYPYLNNKIASEYKNFLSQNRVGLKTVNRRLSTLRHLSKYLRMNSILSVDFMENIINETTSKVPTQEKISKIKAKSPFFSKNIIASGTSKIMIELDRPLENDSQINIWVTDLPKQ